MYDEINVLYGAILFVPFTIHMADGRAIRVPTMDHVSLSLERATILYDDESRTILPESLIAGLTVDAPATPSAAA